jgi:hypothetical protein
MNRIEVERVGEEPGSGPVASLQAFDQLKGTDWKGDYSSSDESVEGLTVNFDPPLFQGNKRLRINR